MLASDYTSKTLGSALIKTTLLDEILPNIQASQLEILYDEGRLQDADEKSFNRYIMKNSKLHPLYNSSSHINKISSTDSLSNAGIWIADFVAGAFYRQVAHKDDTWVKLIQLKLIGRGFIEFTDKN